MISEHSAVRALYKRLLSLYPREFRERLGEPMLQTFQDLCNEKRQTTKGFPIFIVWTFIETAIGIFREHLSLVSPGAIMQTILKTFGSPALISLLLVLPFMVLEVVNRRELNEDFPFMLFFVLWFNLLAISLILVPIMRARRTGSHGASPVSTQRNILLTNPKSAAMISIALILFPGMFLLLESIGWLSLDRLFNGLNPEVAYLPGLVLSLGLILFPVAAGIIASGPIVRTLRAGGSLFAHPLHIIIVVMISFLFAAGVVGMIVDQWPCFMGVPNCD